MRLLSVKLARSIWLLHLIDLNPRGKNLVSSIIPGLVEKYKFQMFPTKVEDLDQNKGVKFSTGTFKDIGITVNFTVYDDGIVCDTRSSTNDSDAFLEEFLNWLNQEFDMMPYSDILRTKLYLSELWIHTDKRLNALNPKLEKFAKHLSSKVIGHQKPFTLKLPGSRFGQTLLFLDRQVLSNLKELTTLPLESIAITLLHRFKQSLIFSFSLS